MSLMVDPLCQIRHQVSQVRAAKGIAVCDEKPAHLEQWHGQLFVARQKVYLYSLFKYQIVLCLLAVYQNKSLISW
ncbi:hypothetical protein HNR26_002690 [Rhizobium rosettiformans]|uniref:Uncharacterized protein n=2 Tax=Rhizobium rosettiformans TaxID=1368430 RepID=A0A4V4HQX6_9HYPH|nr:hypothetical protein [Rhizobium rosettiformans]MBB5276612.1 hypothetical protein [Rhizobium rosettiformans]THV35536.1 hypothetical protein FAA86_13490 [Rhizobium rosettiformans W3]